MPSVNRHHYQPSITRIPSLLCLLVATLGLIAIVEYACRHLPAHNADGIITGLRNKASAEDSALVEARHVRRQNPVAAEPIAPGAPAPGNVLLVDGSAPTVVPGPSDFLPVPGATLTSLAPNPPDFLTVASTPGQSAFLPVDPTPSATTILGPGLSAFLPVDPNPSVIIASTPGQSAFLPADPTPSVTIAPGPGQSAFIPVDPKASVTSFAPAPPVLLPIGDVKTATMINSNAETTVGAPAPTNFLRVDNSVTAPTTAGPSRPLVLPGSSIPPTASSAFSSVTGVANGVPYTIEAGGTVLIDGKIFNTATPTTATLFDGQELVVGPTGAVSIQDLTPVDPSKRKISVTPQDYVVGAFLPTILAVLFSIPWQLLHSAIKEIEPFYQLHNADGVSAEDSLALEYRASVNVVATFTAIRKSHYLVWWSGIVSLIILLLPPLASETVFIGFVGQGRCTATSGRDACFPELSVFPTAARVVQGILAFIALTTFALAIAVLQRKSGVYANPLSIAGLASLFQDQRLIEDFRRINPYASPKELRNSIRDNRYRIGTYREFDGSTSYGMTLVHSSALPVEDYRQTSFMGGKKYASVAVNPVDEQPAPMHTKSSFSPWIHPAVVIAFALFVLGLEALIIYYNRTGGDTGFERFMDSQAFGVNFLFTAIGVILKMYWSLLDDEIRTMEPYRQLLHGDAKASDSILLAPCSNPFTGFFHSISHAHFFNAYTSLVAILSEPLIVALANIPFKPGTAYKAYLVSTYISVAVLAMMLIGIIWFLSRKKTPGMVRRPDTIAAVLLSICGSHMLGDFRGMAQMDKRTRDAVVKEWGKRYAIGRLLGEDGVEREGVDEDMFVGQQEARSYFS